MNKKNALLLTNEIFAFNILLMSTIRSANELFSKYNINKYEHFILIHIKKNINNLGEIARINNLSAQQISRTCDSLEKKGYIIRKIDTNNKRKINIELTPIGNTVIEGFFDDFTEMVADAFSELNDNEAINCINDLSKNRNILKKAIKTKNTTYNKNEQE
ncbi:MAG: MarR family winged helix-turn-helix transcriptional regulator [Anaeroplasma sp.]